MENELFEIKQLLLTILEENKMLRQKVEELSEKIEKPKSTKKVQNDREQCSGFTSKGTRCKNKCIEGDKCRMHSNQDPEQVVQPKPKKEKKKKIEPPTHTHLPCEEPEVYCELCETHGDIMDPTLPDRQFEIVPGKSWADDDDDNFFETS
uniref:Uncharacterized protein n=1 Tax=viral metagenome TaxID=1070528 RepID=A0A6C0JYZ8_9ZZZZ